MRRDIAARVSANDADVDPIAKKAIDKLRKDENPGAQITASNIKSMGEDG